MTIQHNVPSKGRMSIIKIQNFTIEKRHSVIPFLYGTLLVALATILLAINPLQLISQWIMGIHKGSFVFDLLKDPPYQVYCEVWVYNYTNVDEYMHGTDKVLKVQELGPFRFRESRTNHNLTIDEDRGTLRMKPKIELTYLPEESFGLINETLVVVPNIALIAISTLASDKLGYLANAGVYYSMSGLGSKLFVKTTAEDYLWGYYDPVVTIANTVLPGWIDFKKIGILDRFYGLKTDSVEIEVKEQSKMYSIVKWDNSEGLTERGFTDLNSSTLCNRIHGAYEGLIVAPQAITDETIPVFRKQACRVFPFAFQKDIEGEFGFNYKRFVLEKSALSRINRYSCPCHTDCLPDGFVDISSCYYGFPIALSKPHFLHADPKQLTYYEGMNPDHEKHDSILDIEPSLGVPLAVSSKLQVNIAVRTSSGNPITRPVKDKVLPLIWVSLYCKEPPHLVVTLLRLRLVIAPPLLITFEVLLFVSGIALGMQGAYRLWRPKYKLIEPEIVHKEKKRRSRSINMTTMNVNVGYKDDDDEAKEAALLLAIREEDMELPDLIFTD